MPVAGTVVIRFAIMACPNFLEMALTSVPLCFYPRTRGLQGEEEWSQMDRIKIGKVEPAGYKAMVGLHEHGEPPLQPAGAGQPDPGDRDHQRLEPHRHLNADGAAPDGLRQQAGWRWCSTMRRTEPSVMVSE